MQLLLRLRAVAHGPTKLMMCPPPGKEKDIADRKRRKVGTIEVQKQWDAEDCPPKDLTATDEDAITRCIFQRCIAPLQLHKLLQLCQTFTPSH